SDRMAAQVRAAARDPRGRSRGVVRSGASADEDQPRSGRAAGSVAGAGMRLPMIGTDDPVSPTAHYTGYVWARNGLSHPELRTLEGRVLFESLRPVMTANALLGRGTL